MNYRNDTETFVVSHRKALSHHMPVSHFHDTFEIYYLMSGMREFFLQDRTLTISEGDIVIIAPNVLHRTTNTEKPQHERFIVNLHERYFSADGTHRETLQPLFERDYLIVNGSLRDRLSMDTITRQMLLEMRERQPGFELFAQALAVQLLIACCRQARQETEKQPSSPSRMHDQMSEIVRYINGHYMEELSLPLLADKFYISPYYLSRSFKAATGFAFTEYVSSVRIKEAKKLLEGTSLKVNVIARRVGFGSVTHFGRVFKELTGNHPLFYRKKS
ncbi:helix-turn-helix domain-containing protein [Paenibacillus sp. PL2-23]|uniref:helix-turn-helix domain-containing protein n=1 Tax=Paenibacillus sp. PL2-23 TaxID=2100729 RepID=UPI0030F72479